MLMSPSEVHEMLKWLIVELPKNGIKLDITLGGLRDCKQILMDGFEGLFLTDLRLDSDKILIAITNRYMGVQTIDGRTSPVTLGDVARWFSHVNAEFITSPKPEDL